MANLRLKKLILEVVDNQLKANDPPCTRDVYESLLDAGYTASEAKDKIGSVVLSEIYDLLKTGEEFDVDEYQDSLEEMLTQSMDFEDNYHVRTEWDEWNELTQQGYDCYEEEDVEKALSYWRDAWDVFCSVLDQSEGKTTIDEFMEDEDDVYPLDEWLEDYEIALGDADQHEERIRVCQRVLEAFDWKYDDGGWLKCGIGDALYYGGKEADAFEYYEAWLREEPQNICGVNCYSWLLSTSGDDKKAYEVLRRATWGASCTAENYVLFAHAEKVARDLGKEREAEWYKTQTARFRESQREWEMEDDMWSDEFTGSKQVPVVKPKKIYPNDPCPCGSGKKYKKCCGRT